MQPGDAPWLDVVKHAPASAPASGSKQPAVKAGGAVRGKAATQATAGKNETFRLFCGGLSPQTNEASLLTYFNGAGRAAANAQIARQASGESLKYAFVNFVDRDAYNAVIEKGQHNIDGKHVQCRAAKPIGDVDQSYKKEIPCKLFAAGRCHEGDLCPYLHCKQARRAKVWIGFCQIKPFVGLLFVSLLPSFRCNGVWPFVSNFFRQKFAGRFSSLRPEHVVCDARIVQTLA